MIGCDITLITRFDLDLDQKAKKILTQHEYIEFESNANKRNYLAGRWAAKEAIFKATGRTTNFSILNDQSGKPYVLEDQKINVSISHDGDYAMAVACLDS